MLAAMASNIKTVYVRLFGEGTDVFRPTKAIMLSDSKFRLLQTANYDPEDEVWEFPPGSVVFCELRSFDGEEVLLASEIVTE